LVRAGRAIEASNMFTYDNSLAKGRKMTGDLGKLMLRAYNAEADNSIRSLRLGNVVTAKKRLEASRVAIAKLGKMMEMHISDEFHALRLEEIELTADWLMKKQEEKEAAGRSAPGCVRSAASNASWRRSANGSTRNAATCSTPSPRSRPQGAKTLSWPHDLQAVDEAIAQNDFRAANIRAGYVYVISNRGAFGENVVKIGLTRRLEPLDRSPSSAARPSRSASTCTRCSSPRTRSTWRTNCTHTSRPGPQPREPRKEFFFATPGRGPAGPRRQGRQPARVHRARRRDRVPPVRPLLARVGYAPWPQAAGGWLVHRSRPKTSRWWVR
jgi:hypothetical protein